MINEGHAFSSEGIKNQEKLTSVLFLNGKDFAIEKDDHFM
jgi:hypothetical protein